MSKIAIIPARGGSKRIPRKNIKDFCGRPILAYSIQAALDSQLFDEVMVSTDDGEIAEISTQYGASVPFFRSADNANDYATTASVLTEVLDSYTNLGKKFQYGCCIYPTAPFVTAQKLKDAYQLLADKNFDTV
ncbi:MAG TPA: pseudaminic acid cytidylyltransferase, partial [Emticicia sp.]